MIYYLTYEQTKEKYRNAVDVYQDILLEKELLFQMTQPKAVTTNGDRVQQSNSKNTVFDDYLIAKEKKRIDERLDEAMEIMQMRKIEKEEAERVLRMSEHNHDKVYCGVILNRRKIKRVAEDIGYSERQIKRILEKIRNLTKKYKML